MACAFPLMLALTSSPLFQAAVGTVAAAGATKGAILSTVAAFLNGQIRPFDEASLLQRMSRRFSMPVFTLRGAARCFDAARLPRTVVEGVPRVA